MAAEFVGTFWLVFDWARRPRCRIPSLGIDLEFHRFWSTVLTMAYAIGHISGCHLNPAVSAGLCAGGRFPSSEFLPYVIAQVLGWMSGAGILYVIAAGKEGFTLAAGFASNGYAAHSPGGYALGACLTAEVVLTFMFR
jgi:aquaporin Z